jgi:hypothetical protein
MAKTKISKELRNIIDNYIVGGIVMGFVCA